MLCWCVRASVLCAMFFRLLWAAVCRSHVLPPRTPARITASLASPMVEERKSTRCRQQCRGREARASAPGHRLRSSPRPWVLLYHAYHGHPDIFKFANSGGDALIVAFGRVHQQTKRGAVAPARAHVRGAPHQLTTSNAAPMWTLYLYAGSSPCGRMNAVASGSSHGSMVQRGRSVGETGFLRQDIEGDDWLSGRAHFDPPPTSARRLRRFLDALMSMPQRGSAQGTHAALEQIVLRVHFDAHCWLPYLSDVNAPRRLPVHGELLTLCCLVAWVHLSNAGSWRHSHSCNHRRVS